MSRPYEYETNEEYLDSVGLFSNPRIVLFVGPLVLGIKGSVLSFYGVPGEIGLSEAAIKVAETMSGEFTHILTVENLTTFHQVTRSKTRGAGLIIYTGGFPHRGVQLFLTRLKEFLETRSGTIPTDHRGDITTTEAFAFLHTYSELFFQISSRIIWTSIHISNISIVVQSSLLAMPKG